MTDKSDSSFFNNSLVSSLHLVVQKRTAYQSAYFLRNLHKHIQNLAARYFSKPSFPYCFYGITQYESQ